MAVLIAGIIVIAAVICITVYLKKLKPGGASSKEDASFSPPSGPETSPEQEVTDIFQSLLQLNILLRKDKDLANEMTREIEVIIDDLMVITPAMMDRYPGEALTYEIKKIGKQHLFKTVKEYLDLSLESRKNQFDMFKKTIENLHQVSNRSRDIVEKNETAEFKTMANFLAGKFS